MKNNFHLFWLTALMMLFGQSLSAHDFEVDGIYYKYLSIEDKTVSVSFKGDGYNYYNEYSGHVTIPESVTYSGTSYSVKSIGSDAFHGCTGLTSTEIPNSVINIGNSAFYGCTGLKSIGIPNSVTSIDKYAFMECSGLTSIEIPNSVTSIGDRTFENCLELTNIVVDVKNSVYDSRNSCNALIETSSNTLIAGCKNTIIPDDVTSIGDFAFDRCTSLTNIVIPNSVTSIGYYAFYSTSLTSIEIPNSVTTIGDHAFRNCTGLTSIEIPKSVTSIGTQAFEDCTNLTSIIIPNNLTSIGSLAFRNTGWYNNQADGLIYAGKVAYIYKGDMPKNTSIILKNGTLGISGHAFYYCTGLTSIEIPNSVIDIGVSAFYGCSGLTSIEIPKSVTSIGNHAFRDCKGLTSVTALSSTPAFIGYYTFYESNISNATLYVPKGSKAAYEAANYWKEFKKIVEIEVPIELDITDGEVLVLKHTETCDELVYTRTFANTNWQALYVPFSIPVDSLSKYGLQVAEI